MKLRNVGLVALVVTAIVGCDRGNHDGARVTQSGSGSAAADPWNTPAPAKDPLKKPLFWKVELRPTTRTKDEKHLIPITFQLAELKSAEPGSSSSKDGGKDAGEENAKEGAKEAGDASGGGTPEGAGGGK